MGNASSLLNLLVHQNQNSFSGAFWVLHLRLLLLLPHGVPNLGKPGFSALYLVLTVCNSPTKRPATTFPFPLPEVYCSVQLSCSSQSYPYFSSNCVTVLHLTDFLQ